MRPTSLFAVALLALVACSSPTEEAGSQANAVNDVNGTQPTTTNLRIVASNLSSGNLQSYDPGEGARILAALKPDVALMQEFNFGDGSPAAIQGFVTATFGAEYTYARETDNAQIPNGVVSRYPIRSQGYWTDPQTATRGFAWARIDIPGDHDLWAISVHLLTSSSARRQSQATTIVSKIRAEVPAGDYITIGGDFNTGSRTEACVRTLGAAFQVNGPFFPVDTHNNGGTSSSRGKPYDWVLASPDLDALETPAVVGGLTFAHGLVFDSRNFDPLDNVAPVRRGDSGSSNMQHMAVVRDFALPVPAPAPITTTETPTGTGTETPTPPVDPAGSTH